MYKFNKKNWFIMVLICGTYFVVAGLARAGEMSKADNGQRENVEVRGTLIVGLNEKQKDVFMQSSTKSDQKYFYLKQAQSFYEVGEYESAINALNNAMDYANPEAYESWSIHKGMLRAYEAMGKKREFLKEIDWLISKSNKNETREIFLARKEAFLKNHPD